MVSKYLFEPAPVVSVEIAGTDLRFPVNRIFCVGRNYAAHVREMGFDPEREEPCYFTKSARCITPSGSEIPYPPATEDYHHEIELVVALGQVASRESKGPWDIGKDFENSAVISPIRAVEEIGHPVNGRIRLSVNGELRQDSDLENLIWSVPEIIAHLSRLYRLVPGDLIYTGTPDGVGPVKPGESLTGSVAAVGEIELSIRS
jgi:fumarylpyruvate hydrolase